MNSISEYTNKMQIYFVRSFHQSKCNHALRNHIDTIEEQIKQQEQTGVFQLWNQRVIGRRTDASDTITQAALALNQISRLKDYFKQCQAFLQPQSLRTALTHTFHRLSKQRQELQVQRRLLSIQCSIETSTEACSTPGALRYAADDITGLRD